MSGSWPSAKSEGSACSSAERRCGYEDCVGRGGEVSVQRIPEGQRKADRSWCTRNGRPVAVIVGVQDEDEIERLLMAYSPQLRAILEKSRQQFRDGQWLGEEEFWAQFDQTQPAKRRAKPRAKKGA